MNRLIVIVALFVMFVHFLIHGTFLDSGMLDQLFMSLNVFFAGYLGAGVYDD